MTVTMVVEGCSVVEWYVVSLLLVVVLGNLCEFLSMTLTANIPPKSNSTRTFIDHGISLELNNCVVASSWLKTP